MKRDVEELVRERLVKRLPKDKRRVENSLSLAKRDIKTSKDLLRKEDFDWAFSIAYNSMLQAARALMFSEGFRPSEEKSHISVVRFLQTRDEKEIQRNVIFFDMMRRKRHKSVYDVPQAISKTEAENAVSRAVKFLSVVEKIVGM